MKLKIYTALKLICSSVAIYIWNSLFSPNILMGKHIKTLCDKNHKCLYINSDIIKLLPAAKVNSFEGKQRENNKTEKAFRII